MPHSGQLLGWSRMISGCIGQVYVAPGRAVAGSGSRGSSQRAGSATNLPRQPALHEVFTVERLHKVCGQTLADNEASVRLHRRLGFVEEGLLRQQHRRADGAHYDDVRCFGLLRADWPGPVEEPAS